MATTGRLEDLPLPDFLQLLAHNRSSGKLTITRASGQAVLVLRDGRIVYAATNALRDTLGNMLVRRGVVSPQTLERALEVQSRSPEEVRLGSVLMEMGVVSREVLESVIRDQTGAVLEELLTWRSGFFRFEARPIEDRREIEVQAGDLLMSSGFNVERILLEVGERLEPQLESEAADGTSTLGELLAAERFPSLGAELALPFLDAAARTLDRGLLFSVHRFDLRPVGHFGGWNVSDEAPREQRGTLVGPSLLLEALYRQRAIVGPPRHGDLRVLARFACQPAAFGLALPVVAHGDVVLLFYGDNSRSGRPIGLESLEASARELAHALEISSRAAPASDLRDPLAAS
jgi:hypothetical protein